MGAHESCGGVDDDARERGALLCERSCAEVSIQLLHGVFSFEIKLVRVVRRLENQTRIWQPKNCNGGGVRANEYVIARRTPLIPSLSSGQIGLRLAVAARDAGTRRTAVVLTALTRPIGNLA